MKKLSLRKITDEMYEKVNNDKTMHEVESSKKYYYETQAEYLKEILETMGLEGQNDYLKGRHKPTGKYMFLEEDKEFIIEMLMQFTGKMDPLRRADYQNADDEFVVWLSEGIIRLFKHNEVEDDKLNEFLQAINNRVNYPIRKQLAIIKKMRGKLENLVDLIFKPRLVSNMTKMDNYMWLLSMEQDYADFILKWNDIYNKMSEIRQDELNEMVEKEASEMSPEEIEEAEIDWFISGNFLRQLNENEEYRKLTREIDDICGIVTEDIFDYSVVKENYSSEGNKSNIMKKNPRIVSANKKRYEELVRRINEIQEETRRKLIVELLPMHKYREPFKFMDEPDYSTMCGSDELIKEAIEERLQDIQLQKDLERRRKDMENIPNLDIEKILREYKNRFE